MAGSSQGAFSLLGISTNNPTDAAFEFISESLRKTATIIDTDGIKGTRSHPSERTRAGIYTVSGTLTLQPSPEELALLLPWCMGANASGTTFALAETLQTRYVQKRLRTDSGAQGTATYAGCVVDSWTLSSSQGSPLQLDMTILGTTETMAAGDTFPSISTPIVSGPFMHYEGVLTLASSTRDVRSFSVTCQNSVQSFHNNSIYATSLTATNRIVTVQAELPYTSSEQALLNQALAGSAGTMVYTYANYSLSLQFAALQVPAETPVIQGKTDIPLVLNMTARMAGSTRELIAVLDSTP